MSDNIKKEFSEPEKALQYVFRTMTELNASEIHLLLPLSPGVEGSSACRVKGILLDIDPEIETMLGRHGSEIVRLIYTMAVSGDSAYTRDRVMCGRISEPAHLPPGMDGIDVFMIPAPGNSTHVLLRPRPMPAATGQMDSSWGRAAAELSNLVMRPAAGLTVFLSPDSDVATAMMHHAAERIAAGGGRRIMVFDSMPWNGKTNLGISDLPAAAIVDSALIAASAGMDIIILGELHDNEAQKTIDRLLISGIHVWVRLRASTLLGHERIKSLLGLTSAPGIVVKSARLLMNDDNSVKLSDEFAIKWLTANKIPVARGSMQLSPHSDFPNALFIASCTETKSIFSTENDDAEKKPSISEMGAVLVDRGVVCGFDTSRKLS